jgi:hypothetical protein
MTVRAVLRGLGPPTTRPRVPPGEAHHRLR